MYLQRSASKAAPLVLRNGARVFPRTSRHAPQYVTAIAILLPHRAMATDTSTSSGPGGDYPPLGFNADQAKKPLPKEAPTIKEQATVSDAVLTNPTAPKDVSASASKAAPSDDKTLTALATEKATEKKTEEKKLAKKKEDEKKLTVWQKVKREANHYWDGTKLLVTEVRISSKLAVRMAAGYELTRREHRQLTRTVQDLGRLVPFSAFVLVPFAELLLPVALKLFPNMLPSTYEGQSAKDVKAKNLRATRKEVSSFLRQTLQETGLPVSTENAQREEFHEFFRKVRTTGETPTQADVIKVCKIFKDDLTLDNLSRPQLVAICRYMNMTSFGTDNFLRYQVRHRMRQIKRDDRAISFEGVESLSVPELQTACASRGLRTHGMSPGRLRDDLQMWLDLRLKYGVPSTLLVLSNAFMYAQGKEAEMNSQIDALQGVLSSIPEELYHEIELEVHSAEGAATNKQRLEVLKEQQELIDEENQQNQSNAHNANASPKDLDNIDEDEKVAAKADGQDIKEAADEAEVVEKDKEKSSAEKREELLQEEKEADKEHETQKLQKEKS
ncbi:LETM1-domain-containing protein [Mytilinidion resinicola]|uniref:LETM1-domain-containing protein n=1 Tax=Mytilinidion resinicola TaxID=574789 RepID=A0A6A6YDQ9_9PEZI|nr:LETM1-domain-containing protein [Mytilinidion resinicola]KAF2806729.1 LETM1-domain-containing protein [Mytilinidion resinicola]